MCILWPRADGIVQARHVKKNWLYKDAGMSEWAVYCNDGWLFLNKCSALMCLATMKKKKERKKEKKKKKRSA